MLYNNGKIVTHRENMVKKKTLLYFGCCFLLLLPWPVPS